MKVQEHGMKENENNKIYTRKPVCHSSGQNFGSVRLYDCFMAWLILGYGLIAAFVVLAVEFFVKSRLKHIRPIRN